jgi:hypothetical protein
MPEPESLFMQQVTSGDYGRHKRAVVPNSRYNSPPPATKTSTVKKMTNGKTGSNQSHNQVLFPPQDLFTSNSGSSFANTGNQSR